jgi:hypothetical protein
MPDAYLMMVAAVIAGWVIVYLGSRRSMKRSGAAIRQELQEQIDARSAKVAALERTEGARRGPATGAETRTEDEVTPETLAMIADTIAALLGYKVQIRSVKNVPVPSAIANPWAQQGRAVIQASHNLAQRGLER